MNFLRRLFDHMRSPKLLVLFGRDCFVPMLMKQPDPSARGEIVRLPFETRILKVAGVAMKLLRPCPSCSLVSSGTLPDDFPRSLVGSGASSETCILQPSDDLGAACHPPSILHLARSTFSAARILLALQLQSQPKQVPVRD